MTFFFTTLFILLFILLSIVVFSLKNGISPMPTTGRVRRALFDVLPNIDEGMIADLGSGWGNLIFPLASKYRTSEVIGFENSWIPFWFSYFLNGCSNLTIKKKNFLNVSFNRCDLVLCYLFPKGMETLSKKFHKELKPGAIIVSHTFALPGWIPTKVVEANDLHYTKIYFYRKEGTI